MIAERLKKLYGIKQEIKSAVSELYPDVEVSDDFETYAQLVRDYVPADDNEEDYALVIESENPVTAWHAANDSCVKNNGAYWNNASSNEDTGYITSNEVKNIDYSYFADFNKTTNLKNLVPANEEATAVSYINFYKLTDENRRYFSFYRLPNVTEIKKIDATNSTSLCCLFSSAKIREFNGDNFICKTPEIVTDMSYVFTYCSALQSVDLTPFRDMTGVTNINYLFCYCGKLQSVDLTPLKDMTGVTDISYMFTYCVRLQSADLTPFRNMTGIKKLNYLFMGCNNLESVNFGDMRLTAPTTASMFNGCTALKEITCTQNMYEIVKASTNFSNLENVTWYIIDEE